MWRLLDPKRLWYERGKIKANSISSMAEINVISMSHSNPFQPYVVF